MKRLTSKAEDESLTKLGSDQTAAEALQEAETEVGVGKVDRGACAEWRGHGQSNRSTYPVIDLGLTA